MRFVKGFFNILKWVIISLALTLVVSSWWQRHNGAIQPMFMGWGAAVVQTGSMEPNVPVGTLIIIHEQDSYEKGDVVTYIDYRNWSITHRVEFVADGLVSTRGDANEVSDPLFDESAIIGKMVYQIEGVGKVLDFVRQPAVIIVLVGLLIVCLVWDVVAGAKSKNRGKYLATDDKPSVADKHVQRHEQKQRRQQERAAAKNVSTNDVMTKDIVQSAVTDKPAFNTSVKMYVPKGRTDI